MSMTLYHFRHLQPKSYTHYSAAFIAQQADAIGKPLVEIGAAIYAVAQACEALGNRGVALNNLPSEAHWVLADNAALGVLREDILFYAEGSRHSDYMGWGVKKRPHWALVWGERFGWDTEAGHAIMAGVWDEAHVTQAKILAEEEALKTKRVVNVLAGAQVDTLSSLTVAYIAAVADVLEIRHRQQRISSLFDNPSAILCHHYAELEMNARTELRYRTEHTPPEQSSKRKTEALQADWAKANELLKAGTFYFFTQGFIDQAVASAAEPDLRVDFEHLPKMPLDEMPIRWLRDYELVNVFMRWADATVDPASFAYEDKQLILNDLRAKFARIRGQKI